MCVVTVMGTVFQPSGNNTKFMTHVYCIDMLQCGEKKKKKKKLTFLAIVGPSIFQTFIGCGGVCTLGS